MVGLVPVLNVVGVQGNFLLICMYCIFLEYIWNHRVMCSKDNIMA